MHTKPSSKKSGSGKQRDGEAEGQVKLCQHSRAGHSTCAVQLHALKLIRDGLDPALLILAALRVKLVPLFVRAHELDGELQCQRQARSE